MTGSAPGRCAWCGSDPLYVDYHDREWGVPSRDERHLFEMLTGGGRSGALLAILRKRAGYRRAFLDFDPAAVAGFDPIRVAELLADPGIEQRTPLTIRATAPARWVPMP